MRLNYDTFTGRRSVFVCVAAVLILLSWGAFAVLGPEIAKLLSQQNLGKDKITGVMLLIQNGLVVFSVLLAGLAAERDRSLKEKFGLAVDPGYSLQFLFPVFVMALLATYGSQFGLSHLLKAFGREAKPQTVMEMFRTMKPLMFLGFAAITVIATPIAEELAFRHILYRLFRIFLYRKESAVVVSLIFALCHAPLVTMFQDAAKPAAAENSITIHSGVVDDKDNTYLLDHNDKLDSDSQKDLTLRRSDAVDGGSFNEDGTIKPVTQTKEVITDPVTQKKSFPWEMLVIPVIPLFILAMFFQWQYEKSKSIIPSVLMHAGFNLISVVLVALQVAYGKPEEKPAADSSVSAEPVVEAPAESAVEAPAQNDGSAPAAAPEAVPVEAVFFLGF